MNGNIFLYHVLLLRLNLGILKEIKIKNYLFHFYFLIQDYSFTIRNTWVKFYTLVNNINMEGTVSQIFDIGPRFIFMSKNGKIWVIF